MYLPLEQNNAPSDNSTQTSEFFSLLLEEASVTAAIIGAILGFVLSLIASWVQRRADWAKTSKLKRQEALFEFIKLEREEFERFRSEYNRLLGGKPVYLLDTVAARLLIEAKSDYFLSLKNLFGTYMPIIGVNIAKDSQENLLTVIEEERKELFKIYEEEELKSDSKGRMSQRMELIASFECGIDTVTEAKNDFIQKNSEKIGAALK